MSDSRRTLLSAVAAISGIYDILVGLALLLARGLIAQVFEVPLPVPPIHADLNALFVLAIGVGYVLPYRDPDRYRGYLWMMGPILKGAGALAFVADRVVRHSPDSFLLFAAGDGTLAAVTLWALLKTRVPSRPGDAAGETRTREARQP